MLHYFAMPGLDAAAVEVVTAVLIGRVGDTLVAGPMLRALRGRFPKARLRLVAAGQSRQAAELLPWLDERLYLERVTKVRDNVMLAFNLLKGKHDLVVDLNPAPSKTSAAIVRALRAEVKAGFDKERYADAFTLRVSRPSEREPMLERYARLASALGAAYEPSLEAGLSREHEDWAEEFLKSRRQKAPLILIHCGNFKKYDNRWPEEKFAALGSALVKDGYRLLWLAGPGERERVAQIAAAAGSEDILSAPSLGAVGAVMKRSSLVVGSITGTTHLAHAVGARSFGLYAGYTDAVWRPRDAGAGGIVSKEWASCRSIGVDEARHGIVTALAHSDQ